MGFFVGFLFGFVFVWLLVVWLWFWVFVPFPVTILHTISFNLEFPVVDRQCLVLARQCRKKKALAADLHTNKPWQGQHKFWKYVSPIRTYFAWLPEQLARTYCSAALDRRPGLPYGEVHHLQGSESDFRHSMVFQNIYHIGDIKRAQELEVFLRCPWKG